MNEQFCNYEISKKLKDLGFNEKCLAVFYQEKFMNGHIEPYVWNLINSIKTNSDCNSIDIVTAPLWQQVIDWLREKYDLHIDNGWCISDPFGNSQYGYGISVYNKIKDEFIVRDFNLDYYKAREISILKAIDTIKQV